MKITLGELRDKSDLAEHIVTAGMVKAIRENEGFESIVNNSPKTERGSTILDVNLTVNGVSMDLVDFVERWKKCVDEDFDKKVKEEAINLFREKSQESVEKIQDVLKKVENKLKKELGVVDEPEY